MRASLSDLRGTGLGLALAVLTASGIGAQERSVLSRTIQFGDAQAALDIELTGGAEVAISFADGEVRLGDEVIGSYTSGDALDSAWRSLLAIAGALDDGPLATALVGWSPPSGLASDAAEIAARIDEALEASFELEADVVASANAAAASGIAGDVADAVADALGEELEELDRREALGQLEEVSFGEVLEDGISGRMLGSLLLRLDLLTSISGNIDDLEIDGLRVLIGEDVTVAEGTELVSPLVMVDGEIEIDGVVSNDLVVVGGDVTLRPGGVVTGQIHLAESNFVNAGGEVVGTVRNIDIEGDDSRSVINEAVRDAVSDVRVDARPRGGISRIFRNFSRAAGGVFDTLLGLLVLAVGGWLVLFFAPNNLDAIAESARRAPARAFTVGLAGAFLSLPAYILGIVGLAISLIGIPGLLLWVPFFPVAVGLAMWVGYIAVARNLGIWLARQDLPWFSWVRVTNGATLILGGLFVLMGPLMIAHLLHIMGGWFGGLRGFLSVSTTLMNIVATLIGLGAVLTTRAGRKPEYWADDLFASPDPEPHRRTARAGFDAAGFESTTGPAKTNAEDEVTVEVEAVVEEEAPKKSTKKSTTKKSTTKKSTTKKKTTTKKSAKKTAPKKDADSDRGEE